MRLSTICISKSAGPIRTTNIHNFKLVVFYVLVFGFFFACAPSKNIDFQIMQPAQFKLGNHIENLTFCYDSSKIKYLNTTYSNNAIASKFFLKYLKENLQKSPIFQNAKVSIISSENQLWILKDNLSSVNENGVVVVLDKLYIKDTLIIKDLQYANLKSFKYGMIHQISCRTYNSNDMQIIDNHLLHDSVFWPAQEAEWKYQIEIPTLQPLIWDTGIQAGEKYAHHLAPYWADQSRKFFYGNRTFNTAYKLIQMNNLDSALKILQRIKIRKINLNKVFKAYYNKAVVNELQDNLDKAIIMADSAYIISNSEFAKNYIQKLRLRKIDQRALDWQLN